MTAAVLTTPPDLGRARLSGATVALAAAAGVVLGAVDLVLQLVLPYPWADLANSVAVWAGLGFAVGWYSPYRRWWHPAVQATVTLVVAVESYYLTAVVNLGDSPTTMVNAAALTWLAFAVAAGATFGLAGAWARSGRLGPLASAAPTAVFFAEALLRLRQSASAEAAQRADLTATSLLLAGLGVLVLGVAARSGRERLLALLLSVPLAGAGFALLHLVGFA